MTDEAFEAGMTTPFRRTKIEWVESLDGDRSEPIYGPVSVPMKVLDDGSWAVDREKLRQTGYSESAIEQILDMLAKALQPPESPG